MGKLWSSGTSTCLKIASEAFNDNDFFQWQQRAVIPTVYVIDWIGNRISRDSKPSKKDVGENVGE